jgi:primosomal protein N' (replication factor Y)
MLRYYYLVKILSHDIKTPLTYSSHKKYKKDTFVFFTIKNQGAFGIIIKEIPPEKSFIVKEIEKDFLPDNAYVKFIDEIESFYLLEKYEITKKILKIHKTELPKKKNNIKNNFEKKEKKEIFLTKEQLHIFQEIIHLDQQDKKIYLLKGITGSGKTFLFFKLIEYYIKIKKKSVICLFPNTHLAQTISTEIKTIFPDLPLFEYHAQSTKEEKMNLWNLIAEKKITVVCGVHLPSWLPLYNLGFCIVDEEHDSGYQESQGLYLNSKDAITMRCKIANIPLLLSSATPSATTIYKAQTGAYHQGRLDHKFASTKKPTIIPITMKNKKEILSPELKELLSEQLTKKEQTILFVQRKGFYLSAFCQTCKKKMVCSQCSVTLTIYRNHIGKCYRCKEKKIIPEYCTSCKEKTKIKKIGCGIDQVTKKIEELFPQATIKQIESESLRKKDEARVFIEETNQKKYDIIIGTQVLIKGYNFSHVSLVGILYADQLLQIPFYKNTEEMIQQIIQVSGRAGRTGLESSIVIQSLTDHNLEQFFEEHQYNQFITEELEYRKKLELPPYKKLALLVIKTKTKELSKEITHKLHQEIQESKQGSTDIFRPHEPIHEKIKNYFYQNIMIKAENYNEIRESIKEKIKKYRKNKDIKIIYIPNPIHGSYE